MRDDSELYDLLRQSGLKNIREISRCQDFAEYEKMSEANFNLVLNPEARYAALDLEQRLEIPFIELTRVYQIEKIRNQYRLLAQSAGLQFDDSAYYTEAENAVKTCLKQHGALSFSVGEWSNADPFELSLALLRYGFSVKEIFGTIGSGNFVYVRRIAELSPETKIYSNLSPSMISYKEEDSPDFVIGQDAMYYHPSVPGIRWNGEAQPFGYSGVTALFREISETLNGRMSK